MTRLNTMPVLVLAVFGCLAPGVNGGTVIDLSSTSAIVNINARQDGAHVDNNKPDSTRVTYTGWYQPFSTIRGAFNLLEYTVQAGTYNLQIIDSRDAQTLYPSLTTNQLSEIYTGWNSFSSSANWMTDYLVFDSSAATPNGANESQLIFGAPTRSLSASGQDAYNLAKTNGYSNQFYDGLEEASPLQTQYTFTSPETLIFAVPDYYPYDNQGGVSVLISQEGQPSATPAPSSFFLMGIGVVSLGAYAVRKRRKFALV